MREQRPPGMPRPEVAVGRVAHQHHRDHREAEEVGEEHDLQRRIGAAQRLHHHVVGRVDGEGDERQRRAPGVGVMRRAPGRTPVSFVSPSALVFRDAPLTRSPHPAFQRSKPPVDGAAAGGGEGGVGAGEGARAEEGAAGERRGVGGGQDRCGGGRCAPPWPGRGGPRAGRRRGSARALTASMMASVTGCPAPAGMGAGGALLDGEGGVEQEHALPRPGLEAAARGPRRARGRPAARGRCWRASAGRRRRGGPRRRGRRRGRASDRGPGRAGRRAPPRAVSSASARQTVRLPSGGDRRAWLAPGGRDPRLDAPRPSAATGASACGPGRRSRVERRDDGVAHRRRSRPALPPSGPTRSAVRRPSASTVSTAASRRSASSPASKE